MPLPKRQHAAQQGLRLPARLLCTHSALHSSAAACPWGLGPLLERCPAPLHPPPACLAAPGPYELSERHALGVGMGKHVFLAYMQGKLG